MLAFPIERCLPIRLLVFLSLLFPGARFSRLIRKKEGTNSINRIKTNQEQNAMEMKAKPKTNDRIEIRINIRYRELVVNLTIGFTTAIVLAVIGWLMT
jgi:hypothetical protein